MATSIHFVYLLAELSLNSTSYFDKLRDLMPKYIANTEKASYVSMLHITEGFYGIFMVCRERVDGGGSGIGIFEVHRHQINSYDLRGHKLVDSNIRIFVNKTTNDVLINAESFCRITVITLNSSMYGVYKIGGYSYYENVFTQDATDLTELT